MRHALPSGLWEGHYVQWGARHPQKMTLEFADGLMQGDGIDGIGSFVIEGEYRVDEEEVRAGWIKTYVGRHSVLYLGTVRKGRLVGQWELGGFEGDFALHPVRSEPL